MAMVPALQFDDWQWLSLTLAAPGRRLGRLAVPPGGLDQPAPRRGHDGHAHLRRHARRLRLVALRPVPRRRRRDRHDPRLLARPPSGATASTQIYLEVAAGVTVFILAGRYFEARAKRRSGAALRALLELGAKDVAVLRDGAEVAHPGRASSPSATASWSARARRSPPTASSRRAPRPSTRRCSPARRVPVEVGPGDAVTGATVNAGGRLVVRGHPGRGRHRAGPDRPAGRRRPDRQGPGAAARRPGVGRVRARRHRPRRRHPRVLARLRGDAADRGLHRRRRRADHRLPLRARPGHAHRAAGGHRAAAPSSASSSRAPRSSESTRRVDTVVLDKTGTVTTGRMALVDVVAADRRSTRDEVLRLAGSLEDASEHPDRRRPSPTAPASRCGDAAAGRGLRQPPRASACRASSTATRSSPAASGSSPTRAAASAPELADARTAAEAAGRTAVLVGWDGEVRGARRRRRHREADVGGGRRRSCVASGCDPVLLTGDNERGRPRRRRRGRHRRA